MTLAALALVILAGLAGGSILERNRRIAEMQALRASLSEARFSADSCKAALAWEEYDAYMESFTLYNDSVDVWQGRVDSLQLKEAACRALVEAHNNLGDSIRRRREEWSGGAG